MKEDSTLKYQQVTRYLTDLFTKESYTEGQKLPTELELMQELKVSRNTVRKAILELENRGLITRRQGSGSFYIGSKILDTSKETEIPASPEARDSNAPHLQNQPLHSKGLIGLSNFYSMEHIYPEIIRGIEDVLYQRGYGLALSNSYTDISREATSLQSLLSQQIKGLIIEPSNNHLVGANHPLSHLLEQVQIPVVATHWINPLKNVSTVTINDKKAGHLATKHLIDHGHKDIAIMYKDNAQSGVNRFQGYLEALEEAGLSIQPNLIVAFNDETSPYSEKQSYHYTTKLLQEQPQITAIFYFNDDIAAKGYQAIKDLGLHIPNDISVIGYDNFHTGPIENPRLTTFEHPKYHLGKWAAQLLLDEIECPTPFPQKKELIFDPLFIERDSVRDISSD